MWFSEGLVDNPFVLRGQVGRAGRRAADRLFSQQPASSHSHPVICTRLLAFTLGYQRDAARLALVALMAERRGKNSEQSDPPGRLIRLAAMPAEPPVTLSTHILASTPSCILTFIVSHYPSECLPDLPAAPQTCVLRADL